MIVVDSSVLVAILEDEDDALLSGNAVARRLTIVDVLNSSSDKKNATEVKMKQFILSETFGSGFALEPTTKDIRIAADLAKTLGPVSMHSPVPQMPETPRRRRWDHPKTTLGLSGTSKNTSERR